VLIKSAEMPSKGWPKCFDEPIALDDGATLRTLRDAIQYLGKTCSKGAILTAPKTEGN